MGRKTLPQPPSIGHDVVSRFRFAAWQRIALAAVLTVCTAHNTCGTSLPRIDPTGQRLFVWDAPPLSSYKPEPGCPKHKNTCFLRVAPAKVIAPVGAEVVLVSSVCGQDGYMRANEHVEWMLAPGGVGQFMALGERSLLGGLLNPREVPHKLDNSYAIGTTSAHYIALTRGTPNFDDDVPVQKGQAWVTVTSPVEGVSYVTAYAPAFTDGTSGSAQAPFIGSMRNGPSRRPRAIRSAAVTSSPRCSRGRPIGRRSWAGSCDTRLPEGRPRALPLRAAN